MFKVEYTIDGEPVTLDELTAHLVKQATQAKLMQFRRRYGGFICPEHGEAPILTLQGKNASTLTIHIAGCCDLLVDEVRMAVGS